MGSTKGLKEAFARFFEDPSREGLRDLFRDHLGEANEFDFKSGRRLRSSPDTYSGWLTSTAVA
jgi:hypothetical protein